MGKWRLRPRLGLVAWGAGWLAALAATVWSDAALRLVDRLHTAWWRGIRTLPVSGVPDSDLTHLLLDRVLFHAAPSIFLGTVAVGLLATTLLGSLGLLARRSAQARARAGLGDRVAGARAWLAAHPRTSRWVPLGAASLLGAGIAGLSYAGQEFWDAPFLYLAHAPIWGLGAIASTFALRALARAGGRALLAPLAAQDAELRAELPREESRFDAVAVTPEARALVAALAALTTVAVAYALASPMRPSLLAVLAGYAALSAGAAAAFQRASRIAVGLDGVHVTGTSRSRFFAYRELDGVRAQGAEVELLRAGRTALRLQLHGRDLARREAILARIQGGLERAKAASGTRTAHLAQAATGTQLERAASGAVDYRTTSLSREELWALVEGPAVDGTTRAAAAAALARTGDDAPRARLEVVARTCAEPRTRVALEEVLAEAGDPAEASEPGRRAARTR